MSVYNLVTHVADQTSLITITNINMSSLAPCISSLRLQSIFYWAAHYVRHLSLRHVRHLHFSLSLGPGFIIYLRPPCWIMFIIGARTFSFSFSLHHPTTHTHSHTCRNLLKMGMSKLLCNESSFFFSLLPSPGCREDIGRLLMDFGFMTTLIFFFFPSLAGTFWWICCWNFCVSPFFLSFLDDPNWCYDTKLG